MSCIPFFIRFEYNYTNMRSTDIKYLVGLKKNQQRIIFMDCLQCNRFFGTDKTGIETCSIECDAEYALQNLRFEANRRDRLSVLSLSKPYI